MSTMLDEIEAMILAGNQRMAQREELIKSSVLKAGEVYSSLKKPSVILKKVIEKKVNKVKVNDKIVNERKDNEKINEKIADEKKVKQKAEINIQICKSCSKDIKPGDLFCAGCGNKVQKATSSVTVEIPLVCSCGTPWHEGALFCGACGAKKPVVEISGRICPNGHVNAPDAEFCFMCGEKLI